eukprot:COSAG02_NODE_2982_length_7621_cov_3.542808_1_plen_505_part_00
MSDDEEEHASTSGEATGDGSVASGSVLSDSGSASDDGMSGSEPIDGVGSASSDEDSGEQEEEEDDDKYTSLADLMLEVSRLETKLADREAMKKECVAEGWDTGALDKEMFSLHQTLERYQAKVAAREEQAAIERAEREAKALAEAEQREIDKAEAALLKAATDPDREKRRAAIAAAEEAGVCRSTTVEEAKQMDEQLAADVAQKRAEAEAQEAKITAWINAKSEDRERRWGFEAEDEKWVQPQCETGERLRERREYSLSTAAPLITDLFHAVIRRMPDDPVAFCRHYMTMVRDASAQLEEYERNPEEYNNKREAQVAEAVKAAELAEMKASQEDVVETDLEDTAYPESGPTERAEVELGQVARGSPFFEDRTPTEGEQPHSSADENEMVAPNAECTDVDLIKDVTKDDTQNATALFGELYGGGLLGGPVQKNKSRAHAIGVTSYVSAHRRRARGGSYFDDLARSEVLDYSWGQHAKGRAAYTNDHEELFSITNTRSVIASRMQK